MSRPFAILAAASLFLSFFASPAEAQDDRVVLLHPQIVSSNGTPIQEAHLLSYDPLDASLPPEEMPLGVPIPMGLALDVDGVPLVGSVTVLPLRVELLRYAPDALPETFGTIVDSSLRGYIDFIGVDFTVHGQSLYFLQGRQRDLDLEPTRPFRIFRLDLATGSRGMIFESEEDLSGLAVDERGHLFVGVMRYEPLRVEILEIRPNGTTRSHGDVFDSSGAFTLARPVQLAAGSGFVYFLHPRVFRPDDSTVIAESLRRLDPRTSEVEILFETPDTTEGLAVDSRGQVFFGEAVFEPFRLDLLRYRPEDGDVTNFGRAIDTTGGAVQSLKIHIATLPPETPGTCAANDEVACFQADRFAARGAWTTPAGETGVLRTADLGRRDSSAFYFFEPDNLEMLIKVLDGCGVNGHYWVFYSATTDVGFELTVRDTVSGGEAVYTNGAGVPAEPVLDTSAFPCG